MGTAFLFLILAFTIPPFGRAREGQEVVQIAVEGNSRVSAEQLLQGLRTRVGQPLQAAALSDDIRELFQRYGVRVTAVEEAVPGGVKLVFRVDEEALVTLVETRGVKPTRGRELLDEVALGGARSLLEGQVRDRAALLERSLREQGHYFATVGTTIERRDGLSAAVLDVDEGPKVEVVEIAFSGLDSVEPEHLESVMSTATTKLILLKHYLRRDALDRDVVEIERFLHREGYRDATAAVLKVDFNEERDEATVTIAVTEGPRYTISRIRVAGNTALLEEELFAEILMSEGDPLRMAAVERDLRRIVNRYGELGYIRCRAEPKVAFAESGTGVELTYVVEEGVQKHVRDVFIAGNTNTRDETIRREVTVAPGDLADSRELSRTRDRLRALGLFADGEGRDLVDVRFQPVAGDPLLEDLMVDVEETQSGRLVFMAGADTDVGFYGGVHLVKNNFDVSDAPSSWNPVTLFTEFYRDEAFHGAGQKLLIQAMPGNRYSRYRLSFTEPYLTGPDDQPVALTLDAYYQPTSIFEEFDENRLGAAVTLDKRFDDNWNAGVTGRVEMVTIDNVDGDAPDEVEDEEGSHFVPSLGVFARYRDVDSTLDPQEGFELGGRYEILAADGLGQRLVFDGTTYIPVYEDDRGRQQVLALRGSLGAAQGFGDDLPFFERLRGGGASGDFPIRGFEFRRVGPEDDGVHLGGAFGWSAGAEYRFPVYSSYDPLLDQEVEIVRGVLFSDAGSIEDGLGDLFGSPRLALGAGVRVRLPFIGPTPVALDLGVPVLADGDDETQLFSVRVSTRF